jgi:hypothetical protein
MDSDSPGPINDEVIADSEDDIDEEVPGNRGAHQVVFLIAY